MTQKIRADGYEALREALATTTWYRNEFKRLVHTLLREHPELLTPLNFDQTKREVSDDLVLLLMRHERKYQDVTLGLMVELSSKSKFSDIERLEEPQRGELLATAHDSVAHLRDLVGTYDAMLQKQENVQEQIQQHRSAAQKGQLHSDALADLRARFLELQSNTSAPQARGLAFEQFLYDLFRLFDLEPRLAYKLESEQIDGSLRLHTDDYIVEAKWTKQPSGRPDGDLFAAKVRTKGKNALGLFVSVNGFTQDFITRFREGTPFLTMDGSDIFLILEGRIRLTDALLAKKRWANETGSCLRSVAEILHI
ncbi:hypothetical protein [Tessaracoccus antarcticus]|uniref:Restriction endonuclease type IV Mrr domain-containing protein n=1 Tax=Tessaracoccus antarcticus TaxID=2479848 RepID=A0A3M0G164_9ACTN|nr:hypothetical protein [Tessaracoccus antarcticus]RMB58710.1 hypothetical protein EAX62_11255 [Tessaracoccus antarcticus]